ncbi:hypothetical protein CHS0354_024811 [Potamilus streckersoni]|uniref:Uncharacterized protein n=1 Tax=Potamilus streckersoni TaxID=2493646 RepID=A0AAE0W4S8_9BIVA|nr:hypothetical protein CHS0354_024811 [Potamilus streckersoni]
MEINNLKKAKERLRSMIKEEREQKETKDGKKQEAEKKKRRTRRGRIENKNCDGENEKLVD